MRPMPKYRQGGLQISITKSNYVLPFEKYRLIREVQDRWFRYYLILIGAPLAAILTLLQIDSFRSATEQMYLVIGFISALLFLIGLSFLLMYLRQRLNSQFLLARMCEINTYIVSLIVPDKINTLAFGELVVYKHGADFYVNCVHILLNSTWFAVTVFFCLAFFRQTLIIGKPEILSSFISFVLAAAVQLRLRSRILRRPRLKPTIRD